jgi:hypothetical protein
MAKRLNYSRLKFAYAHDCVRWDEDAYDQFTWLPISKGNRYPLLTFPELMVADPGYAWWTVAEAQDFFVGPRLLQAKMVCARAAHILPTDRSDEFVLKCDKSGHLENISIQPLSDAAARKSSEVRVPHLDLSMMSQLDDNKDWKGRRLLAQFVRQTFFDCPDRIRPRQAQLFFETDANFDLTCRERHLLPQLTKLRDRDGKSIQKNRNESGRSAKSANRRKDRRSK